MCLAAIYWARIDSVIYVNSYEQATDIGFDDQRLMKELNLSNSQKSIIIKRITDPKIRENAANIFHHWQQLRIKEWY
jgi:tRNA(Arg) A34 adenosine deaminase TadA